MHIIPVLDVKDGVVVRAIAGRRETYQPLVSTITDSIEPKTVASAMLKAARSNDLYVADLDAIEGDGRVSPCVQDLIVNTEAIVWLDAGFQDVAGLKLLEIHDNVRPILSLESCPPWQFRRKFFAQQRLETAFSMELRNGRLLEGWDGWGLLGDRDFGGPANLCRDFNINTVFVIDLAAVGVGGGVPTAEACQMLKGRGIQRVITGGGVRTRKDVQAAMTNGADAVLVASALHDGTLAVDI